MLSKLQKMINLELFELTNILMGMAEIGRAQFIKLMDPKKDLISKGMAICTFGKGFINDMIDSGEISGNKFSRVMLLTLFYSYTIEYEI